MGKHTWVSLVMTPVEVERQNQELIISSTEGAIEAADEDRRVGCWICNEPLSLESLEEDCPGSED